MRQPPEHVKPDVDKYVGIELRDTLPSLWNVIGHVISRRSGFDLAIVAITLVTLIALIRDTEPVWLVPFSIGCITVLTIVAGILTRGSYATHSPKTEQGPDESGHA